MFIRKQPSYVEQFSKFFLDLTLKLELFTSLIPIPSFVYFIALLGAQRNSESLETIFLAGAVCGTVTIIWGVGIRYYRLKQIFFELEKLSKDQLSSAEKENLKLQILKYPYIEGKTIIQRWVVGYVLGFIFYLTIMKDLPLDTFFIETYSLIFVLPISYLIYVYITENALRKILNEYELQIIPIDASNLIYFGYFRRIALALFSVGVIPTSILGFFLYAALNSEFRLGNPFVHVIAISLLGLSSMFVVSYVVANSLKKSLLENNMKLNLLGKGKFNISSSYTTADDFGKQAKLIGDVARNLKTLYDEIKELNQSLELKVQERTKELAETLAKVTELKKQQDGDYYLTSLLLKPLSRNQAISNSVQIQFLIKQKKKFEFKNKYAEIGGDLCRTETIQLRNKPYVLFVNADAMGKSIQGAGGALVLGAVLSSIIERTKMDSNVQQFSPEKWVKRTFIELHRVFEAFEGSMLVSLVLGLVENQTGFVYYINAEHPFTVLYRDGEAQFLEQNSGYLKLGVSLADNFVQVSGFQMFSGDVLLNGSDGREDLIDSTQTIQNNAEGFLKIVSRAKGKLNKISEILEEEYELTDDLSLMSIELSDGFQSPEEKWDANITENLQEIASNKNLSEILKQKYLEFESKSIQNPFYLKSILPLFLKMKMYKEAFQITLYAIENIPSDTELMFLCSFAARKLKNFNIAIELGERVRIRNVMHYRNLYNLVLCYLAIDEVTRARKIFKQITKIDSPFPVGMIRKLKKIQKKIFESNTCLN